ncbi:glycosyltransferase family 2 protein [candidate division WWE3 bacterium]|nr:glycosyltransferase family 2 protein [candidate division WWE3 bacterium]
MKLSVIVLSYNTRAQTRDCLASLVGLRDVSIGKDFEVIVVDNFSSDGSQQMIKDEFPQVTLIEQRSNLGFSKGNNVGINSLHKDSQYVLFLNPDTIVPSGTLSEMTKFMDENLMVGVATCKVQLADGGIDMDCHRGFPRPWVAATHFVGLDKLFPNNRLVSEYHLGWEDLQRPHEIGSAVGAFLFVRRTIGDSINWFDEDYFLNGEDIDLCYRIHKAGYLVMYYPKVTITHLRGVAKGTRKESTHITSADYERKKMVTNATVNAMQLFYDKHYRNKDPRWKNLIVDAGIFLLRQKRLWSIHS